MRLQHRAIVSPCCVRQTKFVCQYHKLTTILTITPLCLGASRHRLLNILGARDALLYAGMLGHVYRLIRRHKRGVVKSGLDLRDLGAEE